MDGFRVELVPGSVTTELRRAVLRPAWPVGSVMAGDEDPGALHLAAFAPDGVVVGAGTLLPVPYPLRPDAPHAWQLRGMATAEGLRGRGIGALLLAGAAAELARRGALLLWCNARENAISFYARNGFTAEGDWFVTPQTGINHRRMWRELSPAADPSG